AGTAELTRRGLEALGDLWDGTDTAEVVEAPPTDVIADVPPDTKSDPTEGARQDFQEKKPGRLKQGRENDEKKRRDSKKWKRNNPPREPPKHTPGRDHRKKSRKCSSHLSTLGEVCESWGEGDIPKCERPTSDSLYGCGKTTHSPCAFRSTSVPDDTTDS
ncbi:MAG: hypothetical protein ACI8PZ_004130, partial [Myxococcota bacterium]